MRGPVLAALSLVIAPRAAAENVGPIRAFFFVPGVAAASSRPASEPAREVGGLELNIPYFHDGVWGGAFSDTLRGAKGLRRESAGFEAGARGLLLKLPIAAYTPRKGEFKYIGSRGGAPTK